MKSFDIKKLSWSSIVAALFALGIVATTDPETAAIGLVASVIVYAVNFSAQYFGIQPKRAWLTNALFVVAIPLAIFSNPVSLPLFPQWAGDLSVFVTDFGLYLQAVAPIAKIILASAVIMYNALQPLVLDKLPDLPSLLKR